LKLQGERAFSVVCVQRLLAPLFGFKYVCFGELLGVAKLMCLVLFFF